MFSACVSRMFWAAVLFILLWGFFFLPGYIKVIFMVPRPSSRFHCTSSAAARVILQWKLSITRSLGPRKCVYFRYFVISVVNKQYKTKEINSLGPEKLVCYIRYFVISDLFISSFHCNKIAFISQINVSYQSHVTKFAAHFKQPAHDTLVHVHVCTHRKGNNNYQTLGAHKTWSPCTV